MKTAIMIFMFLVIGNSIGNAMDIIGKPFADKVWTNYKSDDIYTGPKDTRVFKSGDINTDSTVLISKSRKPSIAPQEQMPVVISEPATELVPVGSYTETNIVTDYCNDNGDCGMQYAKSKKVTDTVFTYEAR